MRRAWEKDDLKSFIRANEAFAKLFGLNAPEIVEHEVPDAWRDLFKEFGIRHKAAEKPGNGDGRTAH